MGGCRGAAKGSAPAQEPALVSSTFAIRCLLQSCAVSGRPEGLTNARTRNCRSVASRAYFGVTDPTGPLQPRCPPGHPGRTQDADTSTLAFTLLQAGLPSDPFQSSQELWFSISTWPLGFPLPGSWLVDIPAGCGGLIALLSFLLDLGAGPGAERRQGRQAGGGIAETSFSEVHVYLQTALGCR